MSLRLAPARLPEFCSASQCGTDGDRAGAAEPGLRQADVNLGRRRYGGYERSTRTFFRCLADFVLPHNGFAPRGFVLIRPQLPVYSLGIR